MLHVQMLWFPLPVKSFVEMVKYLLSQPETKGRYILSEHFSQDPLENYFGRFRVGGGCCQNPTIQDCLTSAQSLRVQGSVSLTPVRGNSKGKGVCFQKKLLMILHLLKDHVLKT